MEVHLKCVMVTMISYVNFIFIYLWNIESFLLLNILAQIVAYFSQIIYIEHLSWWLKYSFWKKIITWLYLIKFLLHNYRLVKLWHFLPLSFNC